MDTVNVIVFKISRQISQKDVLGKTHNACGLQVVLSALCS